MIGKVLCIILISFSAYADGDIFCLKKGKIKYLMKGKWQHEKSDYCFNSKTGYLIKKSCLSEKCLANTVRGKKVPGSLLDGTFGNPSFKVCRHVKGEPQIIMLWDQKKWVKSARCQFADKSYTDTSTIYSNQIIE